MLAVDPTQSALGLILERLKSARVDEQTGGQTLFSEAAPNPDTLTLITEANTQQVIYSRWNGPFGDKFVFTINDRGRISTLTTNGRQSPLNDTNFADLLKEIGEKFN